MTERVEHLNTTNFISGLDERLELARRLGDNIEVNVKRVNGYDVVRVHGKTLNEYYLVQETGDPIKIYPPKPNGVNQA